MFTYSLSNVSQKYFDWMYKYWPPKVKEEFPTKEVYGQNMSFQLIGERLNIRALLVQDAPDPNSSQNKNAKTEGENKLACWAERRSGKDSDSTGTGPL